MTEVVIENDAEKKRRLPGWMLGSCTADKQRKSGMDDERCLLLGESLKHQDESKVEPVPRMRDRIQTEIDIENSGESLQIYRTKQRTTKASRINEAPGSFTVRNASKKKLEKDFASSGKTKGAKDASKKRNLKSNGAKNTKLDVASSESSEVEFELTVEDLISIAEEYVNADREQQRKNGSETHQQSSIPSTIDLVKPTKATRGPSLATTGCIRLEPLSCGTATSSSHGNDTGREEEDISATENFSRSITKSGNAAQDMLDLFLGPWLRKTPSVNQDARTSGIDGMALVYEHNAQVSSGTTLKGGASLSKKKSSLKDKVAMFLE